MWRHSETSDCELVEDRLEAYVDGELEGSALTRVEAHLESCSACREQLELARAVRDGLRELPTYDAPQAVIARVLATARSEDGARRGRETEERAGGIFGWKPAWGLPPSRLAGFGLLAAAVLAVAVVLPRLSRDEAPRVATSSTAPVESVTEVDEVAVAKATEEARLALAYISRASRRTGLQIRDELVIEGFAAPAAVGLRVLGRLDREEESTANET